MSQAVQTLAKPKIEEPEVELKPFLADLTELSRKYKIGIAGEPVLFCLEDEDMEREYSSDAESGLIY